MYQQAEGSTAIPHDEPPVDGQVDAGRLSIL
jgi:hypothetical protein